METAACESKDAWQMWYKHWSADIRYTGHDIEALSRLLEEEILVVIHKDIQISVVEDGDQESSVIREKPRKSSVWENEST